MEKQNQQVHDLTNYFSLKFGIDPLKPNAINRNKQNGSITSTNPSNFVGMPSQYRLSNHKNKVIGPQFPYNLEFVLFFFINKKNRKCLNRMILKQD